MILPVILSDDHACARNNDVSRRNPGWVKRSCVAKAPLTTHSLEQ